MSITFSKKLPKGNEYSLAVLRVLINSEKLKLSTAATVAAMNQAGLNIHVGLRWESEHVGAALKRIRHQRYTGKSREAMLILIHTNELTIAGCMALFQSNHLKAADGR